MDKITDLYNHYWDQIIAWFDGLEQLYQYGVFFLIFVIGFLIFAFSILSRITK
ncbi:MAG: hypothetical protein IH628_11975 [Proteobacteria bacterium]|nr:hypothetical protein [Pseudomonadota bacterium]